MAARKASRHIFFLPWFGIFTNHDYFFAVVGVFHQQLLIDCKLFQCMIQKLNQGF